MKEIVLNRAKEADQTTEILVKIVTVAMMLIGLGLAFMSLSYVVKNKFNRLEQPVASEITAKVRERQLACLARNIYYEAGGEPFEGKVAVAQVTLNRVASGLFPEDICQVVYQKNGFLCQFSWYCSNPNNALKPIGSAQFNESMEVAKKVLLEGFRLPSLNKALFFHNTQVSPNWNKKRIAQIGGHIFYE